MFFSGRIKLNVIKTVTWVHVHKTDKNCWLICTFITSVLIGWKYCAVALQIHKWIRPENMNARFVKNLNTSVFYDFQKCEFNVEFTLLLRLLKQTFVCTNKVRNRLMLLMIVFSWKRKSWNIPSIETYYGKLSVIQTINILIFKTNSVSYIRNFPHKLLPS